MAASAPRSRVAFALLAVWAWLAPCAGQAGDPPHPRPLPQRAPTDPPPPYRELVEDTARRYRVSALLVHAVIVAESGYRAEAVSPRGAVGLMQLMPQTAMRYGVTDLRDPEQNIGAGTRHLRHLLDAFGQNVALALAAYNAGRGAVLRHGGIPPFPETTRYVSKVVAHYRSMAPIAERARGNPDSMPDTAP